MTQNHENLHISHFSKIQKIFTRNFGPSVTLVLSRSITLHYFSCTFSFYVSKKKKAIEREAVYIWIVVCLVGPPLEY